ncbi:MAG: hypothetical protein V3T72_08065 [Thermoanaerobaculia bacterium]
MSSVRNLFAFAVLLSLVFGLSACTSSSPEEDAAAANAEAWALTQQAKDTLEAKRQEVRDLRAEIASADENGSGKAAADEGGEEGEGGGEGGEDEAVSPEERLVALEAELVKLTEDFTTQVIGFINSQELFEGQDLTETQRAAFDMKAAEDILVAQEYIDKAGNYQKALDIFATSLLADPDSQLLLEARARTEELRYMTEERFAAAKKGMGEAEVREALGTPQPVNIREYDDGEVIAWFYPKAARKAAAGVYFREQRGELKVYSVDFAAIKAADEEAG